MACSIVGTELFVWVTTDEYDFELAVKFVVLLVGESMLK